ncbi:DUF5677 domain-containing protein [Legionella anisa]|uniref:Uncharacterized protein n=1 Tax=Legionella anisa TaxID=28082 RepID=A0AAX0WQL8_9GAMM|nr:DUF5677 domain-containing protein [Legionella anisa]KTC67017.1 hypothetical protein Lani_3362 [Legionella anisa]MBN5937444.1 hypothetical protein [Legionella anisa]MCW8424141.1 DUF5677 domain-containing protein [Legionella anisa]MCW8447664.1 DUF5677 domain-containing protein [Legionella anisa]PNL60410.1 hypothetical protein A6J39_003850 [Legionella anisa]
MNEHLKKLLEAVSVYESMARKEFIERIHGLKFDLNKETEFSATTGLLARQLTLAVELSRGLTFWTSHIAPIIHRCMIDVTISLEWIFQNISENSKKYIEYGLGQMKLMIEHRKMQLLEDNIKEEDDPVLQNYISFLNSQRAEILTEVNVGSWSGKSTRAIAEEANAIDLYNYAFTPFSNCVHSMWPHVSVYNLTRTNNPLHKYTFLPIAPLLPIDPQQMLLAAKYLDRSFKEFDKFYSLSIKEPSSYQWLVDEFEKISNQLD